MRFNIRAAVMLATALLFGCATENLYVPPAGQKVKISQQTFNAFKQYQMTIGSTHPGAFAVSESGRDSYYFYCDDTVCVSGSAYSQDAVRSCSKWGERCYVFARNNDIKYDYEIVP
jgi:hypothetical protein